MGLSSLFTVQKRVLVLVTFVVDDVGVITRFGCGESSPVGADGVRIHLKGNSEYGFLGRRSRQRPWVLSWQSSGVNQGEVLLKVTVRVFEGAQGLTRSDLRTFRVGLTELKGADGTAVINPGARRDSVGQWMYRVWHGTRGNETVKLIQVGCR